MDSIVHEKEMRLKEAMKMMGLPNSTHWIGWFITSLTILTLSCLLLTLILKGGDVIQHSNPLLVFLIFEVFAIASIMFSFLISVFFSKARLASACAGMYPLHSSD